MDEFWGPRPRNFILILIGNIHRNMSKKFEADSSEYIEIKMIQTQGSIH